MTLKQDYNIQPLQWQLYSFCRTEQSLSLLSPRLNLFLVEIFANQESYIAIVWEEHFTLSSSNCPIRAFYVQNSFFYSCWPYKNALFWGTSPMIIHYYSKLEQNWVGFENYSPEVAFTASVKCNEMILWTFCKTEEWDTDKNRKFGKQSTAFDNEENIN